MAPELDEWTLVIEFDDLPVQAKADPELTFPRDECSRLIAHLLKVWAMLPEQLEEVAEWTSTKITLQLDDMAYVGHVLEWLVGDSVPKSVVLTRNGERL